MSSLGMEGAELEIGGVSEELGAELGTVEEEEPDEETSGERELSPIDATLERLQRKVSMMLESHGLDSSQAAPGTPEAHPPKASEADQDQQGLRRVDQGSPAGQACLLQGASSLANAGASTVEADNGESRDHLEGDIGVLESQRRALERRLRASELRRRALENENVQLQVQLRSAQGGTNGSVAPCPRVGAGTPPGPSTAPATIGTETRGGTPNGGTFSGPRPRGAAQAAQSPAATAQRSGRLRTSTNSPSRADKPASMAASPEPPGPPGAGHGGRRRSPTPVPPEKAPEPSAPVARERQASPRRPLARPAPKASASAASQRPAPGGGRSRQPSPQRRPASPVTSAGPGHSASLGSEARPELPSEASGLVEPAPDMRDSACSDGTSAVASTVPQASTKARLGPGRGLVWPSAASSAQLGSFAAAVASTGDSIGSSQEPKTPKVPRTQGVSSPPRGAGSPLRRGPGTESAPSLRAPGTGPSLREMKASYAAGQQKQRVEEASGQGRRRSPLPSGGRRNSPSPNRPGSSSPGRCPASPPARRTSPSSRVPLNASTKNSRSTSSLW